MPLIDALDTPAVAFLERSGVPFKIFHHARVIRSLEEAAAERGQEAEQIIRSILFRRSGDRFVLVLMAGEKQISWKALRAYLGERRLALATPQEVREQTGFEIGAVTPFGLPRPMRILADPSVFAYPEISLGSGRKGHALLLRSDQLKQSIQGLEITPLSE